MSGQNRRDFDERLSELNNWQIDQQKKLRVFQETQRKLLNREHHVLNPLTIHNSGERFNTCDEDISRSSNERFPVDKFKTDDINELFQLKFPDIRLVEPKASLLNRNDCLFQKDNEDKFYTETVENIDDRESIKPKKFLRRGEGLARFRMTLDDFKGAPKIYKEKKIKTYLNGKPEPKSSRNIKLLKCSSGKGNRKVGAKTGEKSNPLPVKIYVPENKPKQPSSSRSSDTKLKSHSSKKLNDFFPKKCVENLELKPYSIATEWYNIMKEKEKECKCPSPEDKHNSVTESDISKKKDEKELEIFEMLEKKVDDSSFCSNSSFIDKLLEQSSSSTPVKSLLSDKNIDNSYAQGLKFLRSQFLNADQVKRFEEIDKISLNEENIPDVVEMEANMENDILCENNENIEKAGSNEICGEKNLESPAGEAEFLDEGEQEECPPPPHKVNKTLLQEYIRDFKKLKHLLEENSHRLEDEQEEEIPPQEFSKDENAAQVKQREIALKLQRKGLQDNVKHLLNWDCPPRKKQLKRVVKKTKPKPRVEKARPVSKEQEGKIIFNSSLLQLRLSELEKEIEIFKKENKKLDKLQKECNEERIKLSKERKEFEKQMQEEKEKFEAKISEEQKKLQKEKAVFEKYCKQVRNQPTRHEREETANLKKEIEKLTETLTTKEARWGASQARLRNQVKNLEKERSELKAELEKYKKMSMKKVSFENERNLSTKIIHVINSELGKLKPAVIKNTNRSGRNQSLSARSERPLEEKPIRRIKSAPTIKKPVEIDLCTEASNDDEKVLGSVSADSGFETNGSRCVGLKAEDLVSLRGSDFLRKSSEEPQKENSCRDSLFSRSEECPGEIRSSESTIESVVREAIFGESDTDSTSLKITDIKNRLERLSLLGQPREKPSSPPVTMVKLPSNHGDSESDEGSRSSGEDEDDEKGDDGEMCDFWKTKDIRSKKDSYSSPYLNFNHHKNLLESKLDENGIWEKLYEDGSKEINYPNGNVKKIFPGSRIVRMTYYNGDIKETNVVEGSEKYYYAETKTWHTTYKDGLEVLEFPNGQTERRYANGTTEISFPNGCVRYYHPSGKDEWRFSDGTVIKTNECGHKILLMPNGQKEIHTKEFKKREYPDGTIKILYSDGTQETRYSSGRVRLKDKDGNLVMDSGGIR